MKAHLLSGAIALSLLLSVGYGQTMRSQKDLSAKKPVNMGESINSDDADFNPQVDPTGKRLYFSSYRSSRFGSYTCNVYMVEFEDSVFKEIVLLPEPINSSNNEGCASFAGDGQTMVYVRCNRPDGIGSCDLYLATRNGDTWNEPVNMGPTVNSSDWDSQCTMSADGNSIIFSSRRNGGYGKSDLYITRKNEEGIWSNPTNLGKVINTSYDEYSPNIAADGKTVYFSSEGHGGEGGDDIYRTSFDGETWSTPVNLGKPINTSKDDAYFTVTASGDYAFMASTREGGMGDLDLYKIRLADSLKPTPTVVISGKVSDSFAEKPIEAKVSFRTLGTNTFVSSSQSNSLTGAYLNVLTTGRDYVLIVSQEGYETLTDTLRVADVDEYKEVSRDYKLVPTTLAENKEIRMVEETAAPMSIPTVDNLLFETNQSTLSASHRIFLAPVLTYMQAEPDSRIEIVGHTDDVGNDSFNGDLSLKRARAVQAYLLQKGIEPYRIQVKGMGESAPLSTESTDAARAINRRVECVILR